MRNFFLFFFLFRVDNVNTTFIFTVKHTLFEVNSTDEPRLGVLIGYESLSVALVSVFRVIAKSSVDSHVESTFKVIVLKVVPGKLQVTSSLVSSL